MVGFEVEPLSVDMTELEFEGEKCRFRENPKRQVVQPLGTTLYFTYSVKWKNSNVEWASRWDIYLSMRDVDIHWFSILNSLVVVFFLSGKKGSEIPLSRLLLKNNRSGFRRYPDDDHNQDFEARHSSLQRGRRTGRSHRRDGLETRSRRRVSSSSLFQTFRGSGRQRSPDRCHGADNVV